MVRVLLLLRRRRRWRHHHGTAVEPSSVAVTIVICRPDGGSICGRGDCSFLINDQGLVISEAISSGTAVKIVIKVIFVTDDVILRRSSYYR